MKVYLSPRNKHILFRSTQFRFSEAQESILIASDALVEYELDDKDFPSSLLLILRLKHFWHLDIRELIYVLMDTKEAYREYLKRSSEKRGYQYWNTTVLYRVALSGLYARKSELKTAADHSLLSVVGNAFCKCCRRQTRHGLCEMIGYVCPVTKSTHKWSVYTDVINQKFPSRENRAVFIEPEDPNKEDGMWKRLSAVTSEHTGTCAIS